MSLHKSILRHIEESPSGPHIGALFDFDGTIIAGYSALIFLKAQLLRGDMPGTDARELLTAIGQYSIGSISFSGLMAAAAKKMQGTSEQDFRAFGEELYQQQIAKRIYPESRALLTAHLKKGHTVAIISSATPYQVLPAARDLNVKHVMCSQYQVKDGIFTGEIEQPLCFGTGKLIAAEKLAVDQSFDLEQSFFYSDSDDDLELLERVGHPQVLNPNSKLSRIAEQRSWPTRHFDSRGRPRLAELVRSIAATGSLVTSFAAGLPIWALTGSKRKAQNFSISLFADTASALTGLDLVVKGEEHLWEQRPAVFVFNHQSKADVIIVAKLLRRDIAAVGKKEIKDIPILGKVMELSGVVMIDRKNTQSAIEAMKPLVDAIRNEGKSVCIAPEGTRTITSKLAPFKSGAFHLAMQAGVPVIPIVIQNSLDVAPKGDFVYRPATVEVEILPPVDTSDWTPKNIKSQVEKVRGMFLKALDQQQDQQQDEKKAQLTLSAPGIEKPIKEKNKTKTKVEPKAKAQSKTKPKAKAKPKAKPKAKAEPGAIAEQLEITQLY